MRTMAVCMVIATASGACRENASHRTSAPVLDVIAGDAGPGTATTSSIVSVAHTPSRGCPALRPEASQWPGTVHANTVVGNETWTPEGSPHRVPNGLVIASGASVTFTPCTLVVAPPEHAIVVADGGALFAMGERTRPVRFAGITPGVRWGGIHFARGARETSRMVDVRIESATIQTENSGLDATRVHIDGDAFDASIPDARGAP